MIITWPKNLISSPERSLNLSECLKFVMMVAMSESEIVSLMAKPNTTETLSRDFSTLGLCPGMTVIVHSSLSSMGWVCGGPIAVIHALMSVLTESGTLVMPTHSSGYSEPSYWKHPPVPESWWSIIRDSMPGFDPKTTPSSYMGAVAEAFRTFPGVLRSDHPATSFAAWGSRAQFITSSQGLDYSLGNFSPLARIYDLDGSIR